MTNETLDSKVALIVDGPNMFQTDFNQLRSTAQKYGSVVLAEVYLSKSAGDGLQGAVMNCGYRPVMQSFKDVDTALTVRAVELICSPRYDDINFIALASRDGDYLPAIFMAREYRKKTVAICCEGNGISAALRNAADFYEEVKPRSIGLNFNNGGKEV